MKIKINKNVINTKDLTAFAFVKQTDNLFTVSYLNKGGVGEFFINLKRIAPDTYRTATKRELAEAAKIDPLWHNAELGMDARLSIEVRKARNEKV